MIMDVATLVFLIAIACMIIITPIALWNSYSLYKYAKNNEREFFQKNINPDRWLSSPWMHFGLLCEKASINNLRMIF